MHSRGREIELNKNSEVAIVFDVQWSGVSTGWNITFTGKDTLLLIVYLPLPEKEVQYLVGFFTFQR